LIFEDAKSKSNKKRDAKSNKKSKRKNKTEKVRLKKRTDIESTNNTFNIKCESPFG
jgi:hypothetical protein